MYVAPPPEYPDLMSELGSDRLVELLGLGAADAGSGEYLHWDKLRHLEPPQGLTHHEWWFLVKFARRQNRRTLPLHDEHGAPLNYSTPDEMLRLLHFVDQRCSGEIAMAEVVTADDQARQHYLVNSLMEEAIRSSQLEGATTSRRIAKEMLRSGREPVNRSERMILNNYRAMQFMREGIGDRLTPGAVLELHRTLTEGTLDDPDAAGRLQRPEDERVSVFDRIDGTLIYSPPPAAQLPDRLDSLCRFANEPESSKPFVHPVLRAIALHFWLAYDHPFADGNGRTARALFYWFMRTRGYWLVEYLSISKTLRQAPAQYTRAYVLTETDEGDVTYFLLYNLGVIQRAVDELHMYLGKKAKEIRTVEGHLKAAIRFNHRQLALLGDAIRRTDAIYTFRSHAASHGVTHETARTDLRELLSLDLLLARKLGRQHAFTPATDLVERLDGLN